MGSKHTLTSPTYFLGSIPPTPRIYAPELFIVDRKTKNSRKSAIRTVLKRTADKGGGIMGLSRTVSEIDDDFSRKSQNLPALLVFCAPAEGIPLGVGQQCSGSKTRIMGNRAE